MTYYSQKAVDLWNKHCEDKKFEVGTEFVDQISIHEVFKFIDVALTLRNNISGGYEKAYQEANNFMRIADEKLKNILVKLNDDECETLRDRFADFQVYCSTTVEDINEEQFKIQEVTCSHDVTSLPDGWKIYECTNCGQINIKKDNGKIIAAICDNCNHVLWNDDVDKSYC